MSACIEICELLSSYLEAELTPAEMTRVAEHLDTCEDCSETLAAMQLVAEVAAPLAALEPPRHLHDDLVSSPCRLWLGLLFRAVDRELSETNLARLLAHFEECEGCRRTWNDLTLIHQLRSAIEPPEELVQSCVSICRPRKRRRIIGRRTAVAAAYALAVLIGPPVTSARYEAAGAVQKLSDTVSSEVAELAENGRGEARVMTWRAWQWANRQIDTISKLFNTLTSDDDSDPEQGGSDEQHERY
jgi:predicted anti-sigma-YlaC factor YlaD